MNELWKDIENYEGIYQVSNLGNVRSLNRIDASGHKRKGIQLKLMYDKHIYPVVKLCKEGKIKTVKVHRLVGEAFIPNPEDLAHISHINGIKQDNRVENLIWVDANEGEMSGLGKAIAVKGTHVETGEVIKFKSAYASEKEGFDRHNITACCKKRLQTHKGYKWEYDVA